MNKKLVFGALLLVTLGFNASENVTPGTDATNAPAATPGTDATNAPAATPVPTTGFISSIKNGVVTCVTTPVNYVATKITENPKSAFVISAVLGAVLYAVVSPAARAWMNSDEDSDNDDSDEEDAN
jgi:hypothetical protein